jgi:hypothetical protein
VRPALPFHHNRISLLGFVVNYWKGKNYLLFGFPIRISPEVIHEHRDFSVHIRQVVHFLLVNEKV